jgi:hypothetical protein
MKLQSLSGLTKAVVALSAGGVLAGAIALGAGGGNGSSPSAQVALQTPTSVPERIETGRFDPQKPRTDCPPNWISYVDPDGRFSFCHPADLKPVTERRSDPGTGLLLSIGEPVDQREPKNAFVMTISWSSRTSFVRTQPSTSECATNTGTTTNVSRSEFISAAISSRTAVGCHWRGQRGSLPSAGELSMEIPFDSLGSRDQGVIRVRVDYAGPDLDGTFSRAQAIIDTIRLP